MFQMIFIVIRQSVRVVNRTIKFSEAVTEYSSRKLKTNTKERHAPLPIILSNWSAVRTHYVTTTVRCTANNTMCIYINSK